MARVVPFDPAYALHVRTCLAHPEVAHFQRIDWHCELAPAGQLKLVDPYFVAGQRLISAMLEDIDAAVRHYSVAELRGFLEISVFEGERDHPGPVLEQLRAKVDGLETGS